MNLLSVTKLNQIGWNICFLRDGNVLAIDKDDQRMAIGKQKGDLFSTKSALNVKVEKKKSYREPKYSETLDEDGDRMPSLKAYSSDSDSEDEYDDMPSLAGDMDGDEEEEENLKVILHNDFKTTQKKRKTIEPSSMALVAKDFFDEKTDLLTLIHGRFGHINMERYKRTSHLVTGMHLPMRQQTIPFCDPCALTKAKRISWKQTPMVQPGTVYRFGEKLNDDLKGPIQVESIRGAKYWCMLVEHVSRYRWVFFLRHKSDTIKAIKTVLSEFKNKGLRLRYFKSDWGKEFHNREIDEFFQSERIQHEFSPPETPKCNSIVGRSHGIVFNMALAMLLGAKLPPFLWSCAVKTAVYIVNRCETKGVNQADTPYRIWHGGSVPDVSHMKVFGCDAYTLLYDYERQVFGPRGTKGKF